MYWLSTSASLNGLQSCQGRPRSDGRRSLSLSTRLLRHKAWWNVRGVTVAQVVFEIAVVVWVSFQKKYIMNNVLYIIKHISTLFDFLNEYANEAMSPVHNLNVSVECDSDFEVSTVLCGRVRVCVRDWLSSITLRNLVRSKISMLKSKCLLFIGITGGVCCNGAGISYFRMLFISNCTVNS